MAITIEEISIINPGEENRLQIELENNGNGPAMANLEVDGIPNDWMSRFPDFQKSGIDLVDIV